MYTSQMTEAFQALLRQTREETKEERRQEREETQERRKQEAEERKRETEDIKALIPVSYTHLDVYKRQLGATPGEE